MSNPDSERYCGESDCPGADPFAERLDRIPKHDKCPNPESCACSCDDVTPPGGTEAIDGGRSSDGKISVNDSSMEGLLTSTIAKVAQFSERMDRLEKRGALQTQTTIDLANAVHEHLEETRKRERSTKSRTCTMAQWVAISVCAFMSAWALTVAARNNYAVRAIETIVVHEAQANQ